MTTDEEVRHFALAESELRKEYPEVPAQTVREAIQRERTTFDDATIRDFVPLLVISHVRNLLRQHALD